MKDTTTKRGSARCYLPPLCSSALACLLLALAALFASELQANPELLRLNAEFEKLGVIEQAQYRDLSEQLRCPTCTGLSVLQSDAPFSLQIRAAVLEQVKQGKTNAAILQFFTERYGLWILREPPKEGVHILAWLIPTLLLLLGPLALWYFVWRRRQSVTTFGLRPTEAILEEMEGELARLRTPSTGAQA